MPPVWIVLLMLPLLGGAERFNCRGRILGAYYADAKSGCKAFHVCVRVAGGGIRDFRFFCPPGTLFHQEAQTCTDWGDDDPLACPADLYDGQFDLYKIGSGYDTKKLSSQGNRDEESEFGLQRAETGDRRSQSNNNQNSNGGASDLRTAHSSDFFSGQRDRGRDDTPPRPAPAASPTSHRQSFRRVATPRAPSTPYSSTPTPQQPEVQYESHSKRKLVRKRPIYVSSTQPPTTFAQSSPSQEQQYNQQRSFPQQNQQQINQQQQQQQQKQQFANTQQPYSQKPQPPFPTPKQNFPKPPQQYSEQPQQNFNQRVPTTPTTPPPPTNLPAQYKDEYVEVSRVAPIKKKNRYYINTPAPSSPTPFSQTSSPYFNKKDNLAELYNYNAQSTPALNTQNENKPFKVRNSFNVQLQDVPREDFARINTNYQPNNGRGSPTTADYSSASTRAATTTPAYKNFNSVSYEPDKNNFVQYNNKQSYYSSPSTTPVVTTYATTRPNPPKRLNTVAYNTNNALNTVQQSNFADNDEDDGQYRPPEGEDDGQYRPELYERELLSGAHSLNIAASGNRLSEDQKQSGKSQIHSKPTSQAPVPRPFRPAPTQPSPPVQTTRAAEPTFTTTYRAPTVSTERTFDTYKSYTTTARPEPSAPEAFSFPAASNPPRPATTAAPRTPEPRAPPPPRAPASPSIPPPRPSTRAPLPAKHDKEDSSYDYAYYDSDPGFTEYDHIEEFGRTKKRT